MAVTEAEVIEAALALPDVAETAWGFRVNGNLFAALNHRYEETALVVWVKDLDEKDAMLESRPDLFFTKPHYDGHASVLARLSALTNQELRDLLGTAHRLRARLRATAPKRPRRSRG